MATTPLISYRIAHYPSRAFVCDVEVPTQPTLAALRALLRLALSDDPESLITTFDRWFLEYKSGDLVQFSEIYNTDLEVPPDDFGVEDGSTLYLRGRFNETERSMQESLEVVEAQQFPLHYAAESGNTTAMKILLGREGAQLDPFDDWECTPLHTAAYFGKLAAVRFLVSRGADVNAMNIHSDTPMHYAARQGNTKTMKFLFSKGSNALSRRVDGSTPLHCAVASKSPSAISFLLSVGADIQSATLSGDTPLHVAVEAGHEETVQLILSKGADINAVNTHGHVALHTAAMNADTARSLTLLLDSGADVRATEHTIQKALQRGNDLAVRILIANGATP